MAVAATSAGAAALTAVVLALFALPDGGLSMLFLLADDARAVSLRGSIGPLSVPW